MIKNELFDFGEYCKMAVSYTLTVNGSLLGWALNELLFSNARREFILMRNFLRAFGALFFCLNLLFSGNYALAIDSQSLSVDSNVNLTIPGCDTGMWINQYQYEDRSEQHVAGIFIVGLGVDALITVSDSYSDLATSQVFSRIGEICPNLTYISTEFTTSLSVMRFGPNLPNTIEDFQLLDFIGTIFLATDSTDGNLYRYTVGYEGSTDTRAVFRRELVSLPDPEPEPGLDEAAIERVLSDDLLRVTKVLSGNASDLSKRAADRLIRDGAACGRAANAFLQENPVLFMNDSFFIDARYRDQLDEIAGILASCPDAHFMIAGHTDWNASDAYNLVLSQNRVKEVKAALVRRGIAGERLETAGFGESRPIASNTTAEGRARNRRVEFIFDDGTGTGGTALASSDCAVGNTPTQNLNASENSGVFSFLSNYRSKNTDCATGAYRETWGEVNITDDDRNGTLGLLSFGTLRESQYNGVLRGRFIEGYVTKYDVETVDVTGTIEGFGVHGGLYGARALPSGLTLSYYGSAAFGQHRFDLDASGAVTGDYSYGGIFAGGSISGEVVRDTLTLKPRVGLELAYAKALDESISDPAIALDIEDAEYLRGYVDLGFVRPLDGGGEFSFTPRLFCEINSGVTSNACGYGLSIGYETAQDTQEAYWDMLLNFEAVDDRTNASLRIGRSKQLYGGAGVSKSGVSVTQTGTFEISHDLQVKF